MSVLQEFKAQLSGEVKSDNQLTHSTITYDGHTYHVGDTAYFSNTAFGFSVSPAAPPKKKAPKNEEVQYMCNRMLLNF